MIDDVELARALHVLFVAHWIGGVSFVTLVALPLARAASDARKGWALFESIENRFSAQVRWTIPLAGATGLWMTWRLELWARFSDPSFWWMDAMVLVWALFMIAVFVIEPFAHRASRPRRRAIRRALCAASFASISSCSPPRPSRSSARSPDRAEDCFHERRASAAPVRRSADAARAWRGAGAAEPRVPPILPRRLASGRWSAWPYGRPFSPGRDRDPDRLLGRRLARARDDLRLWRRGRRGFPADRDPQLDRPPAGRGRAARRPRRPMGGGPDRRVRLGADRPHGRGGRRRRVPRRLRGAGRARGDRRQELAEPEGRRSSCWRSPSPMSPSMSRTPALAWPNFRSALRSASSSC